MHIITLVETKWVVYRNNRRLEFDVLSAECNELWDWMNAAHSIKEHAEEYLAHWREQGHARNPDDVYTIKEEQHQRTFTNVISVTIS